jgi:hypothetical protein
MNGSLKKRKGSGNLRFPEKIEKNKLLKKNIHNYYRIER